MVGATKAPSEDKVFDALALKSNAAEFERSCPPGQAKTGLQEIASITQNKPLEYSVPVLAPAGNVAGLRGLCRSTTMDAKRNNSNYCGTSVFSETIVSADSTTSCSYSSLFSGVYQTRSTLDTNIIGLLTRLLVPKQTQT